MSNDGYNGWSNRETWALALHLSNNQGDYEYWCQQTEQAISESPDNARFELAQTLECWLEELYELIEEACTTAGSSVTRDAWLLFCDVGSDIRDRIDFIAIADDWIDEARNDQEEK